MKRIFVFVLAIACLFGCASAQMQQPVSTRWYEVFVRSYQDSDGDGIGDLPGLIDRLDYIDEMGYDGLWLMPVMPSPSYHKYDVTDYCAIDPEYGTIEDFKELARQCHARGIRLIVDLPVNHTSTQHPWFVRACEALRSGNADDPFVEYYCFSEQGGAKTVPLSGTQWAYEEQFSGGGMPDLNLDNEAVRGEIRAIMDFWLNECGADGFRLDAVTSYYAADVEKNVEFLGWLKQTAEELKPGSFLVGEAWVGLTTIAEYYASGLDCFFLFPAAEAEGYIARIIRARSNPAQLFVDSMQKIGDAMGEGRLLAPFLGNHDTGRAVGSLQARSVPERAKFAFALANLLGGATFTYYGDEIGMVGSGDDPNKRLAMYWNDGDMTQQPPGVNKLEYAFPCADEQLQDENSILRYYKEVNLLKEKLPAIALGKNEFLYCDGEICVMRRTWNGQECYLAVNFSAKNTHAYTLEEEGLSFAGQLNAFAQEAEAELTADGAVITLPPYSVIALVK
ncbi:MAG: alpha-amylase family glycosyl hydrolase [Eubacteriales bacterium]|nr:alpha-amylase family glycosyl hydrolase [Eubacteriales bacterium]